MKISPARLWPPGASRFRTLGWIGVIGLVLMALLVPASPALSNDTPGNNGTVKIHEGNTENDPGEVRNEPHVCTFHLHFYFADPEQSGTWEIQEWAPDDKGTVVLTGTYDTAGDGEDRQPEDGVYTLPDGHYKLFWDGDLDTEKHDKMKVFWVDCPAPTESVGTETEAPSFEQSQAPETEVPSEVPSEAPSEAPSFEQSEAPGTEVPPSEAPPSEAPSFEQSEAPGTEVPPTEAPPTEAPSFEQSEAPGTEVPPTEAPSFEQSQAPATEAPSEVPSEQPSEVAPSEAASEAPTEAPSFEQSQGPETTVPSFGQSVGAETNVPGPTQPNTSTDPLSGPDNTGWRGLMIALAFLLALVLVVDPSRPLGRERR